MTVLEYKGVLEYVSRLSKREKLDLMIELDRQLSDDNPIEKKHSIMELEGLGKEIWAGIDAQEYVDSERDAWNG